MSQHNNNGVKSQQADHRAGVVPTRPAVEDPVTVSVGSWTYRVQDDSLSWSDSYFELFGFGVHEVVPTLALMSRHQHPQDRASWDQQVQTVLTVGSPASVWHRIIDVQGRYRTLHTVMHVTADSAGNTTGVVGATSDLTDRLERDRSSAATEAVARAAQTRGVIDQAKGIIMATMNVEEQAAFDLLRWHSSYMNLKLRDIAAALVQHRGELTGPNAPAAPRERLTAIITGLTTAREPALPTARSISDPATDIDIDVDQETARTGQISPANLPRTMIRAVAAAAQSISITDYNAPDQPLVYINRAFERLTGYPAEEILGRNCRFLQGPAGAEKTVVAELRRAITAGEELRTAVRNYRRDGTPFWNELHLSAVRDAAGRITHYIGYQTDISERVHREQQLEHLAFHDARTGLPNQAAAVLHLQGLLTSGGETGQLVVGQVHISGFRGVDGFEHPDAVRTVLATAAQRLQTAFPPPVYLAKLEEDTFLVLADGTSSLDVAAQVLADPIPLNAGEVALRVRLEVLDSHELAEWARTAGPGDTPAG